MEMESEIKENQLLLMITEDHLKSIIESSIKKIMLELREDAPEVDEWLTSKQVCKMLHVSKSTLVNWRSSGKLISHKLGSRLYFKREEILSKIAKIKVFESVLDSVH